MKYEKLRDAIREKYRTNKKFAGAMCMDPATLSAKLNGKRNWGSDEIAHACKLLDIQAERMYDYFFSEDCCLNKLKGETDEHNHH